MAMKQVGSHLPWEPFVAYVDDGHNEGIAEKLVRCILGRVESLVYGARDLMAGCAGWVMLDAKKDGRTPLEDMNILSWHSDYKRDVEVLICHPS